MLTQQDVAIATEDVAAATNYFSPKIKFGRAACRERYCLFVDLNDSSRLNVNPPELVTKFGGFCVPWGKALRLRTARSVHQLCERPGMHKNDAAYRARVRYSKDTAEKYQGRSPRRDRAEMQLIARVFADVESNTVLDIASGGGRVGLFLAEKGYQVTCADYSEAMVDIARRAAQEAGAAIAVDRQDIEAMTYADAAFDTVICFRLFHHFPDRRIRARAVQEMCRVARERVALSYFSPFAFSAIERKVRGWVKGNHSKYSTSLSEVREYFARCGFHLLHDFGQTPLLNTLHVGLFERDRTK